MNRFNWGSLILPLFVIIFTNDLLGQKWNFVKQKDDIKLYTRPELNSEFKAYRGEVTFKADIEKVNLLVGDADNLDWWDKDIIFKKVLDFKRNDHIQYYIIFNLPGPLSNRDLALDARITIDPVTGVRTVSAKPLLKVVPEKPDLVRIKKYWQKWTIQPLANGYVHVILEGFVEPNGNVPSWIHNMVVPDMPLKALKALRERTISARPANK